MKKEDDLEWKNVFWKNLPNYILVLKSELEKAGFKSLAVGDSLQKLSFSLPKGLKSKEIQSDGEFPVISQSKEYIIGYSDREDLTVNEMLPLIVFGDHSKTIKYVDMPFVIGADGVKLLKPSDGFNVKYYFYFLHGVITDTKDYGRHFKLLREGEIPLIVDLNTQISIVNFLEDLESKQLQEKEYFDIEIERKITSLQENQVKGNHLSTELTHQLDLVKQLRQAFLREAMQGKLVPQDPNDEPASVLLEKIKAEKERLIKKKKLKRGKASSQTVSKVDEWSIPSAWVTAKTDDIFFVTKLAGFEYTKHINLKETGEIPVIRAQNVRPFIIDKTNLLFIDEEISLLLDRCALTKESLLVTFIGAGIGDVARFCESERWHLAPNVAKLEPFEGCEAFYNLKYLNYFLSSPDGREEIFKHVKATAQPSLSMGTIRDIDVPLPPLSEQHRIVAKLDELMGYCDELEASIKESQQQNEQLLQQVLREALEPKEKEVTG